MVYRMLSSSVRKLGPFTGIAYLCIFANIMITSQAVCRQLFPSDEILANGVGYGAPVIMFILGGVIHPMFLRPALERRMAKEKGEEKEA